MKNSPIRVMLVDDHKVVRSGLSRFLMVYPDLELICEASNGERAVTMCGQFRPDVILMDIMMPRMNGVEATRAIREQYPESQVIALTSFVENELIQDILQAGAIGYLLKDVEADELVQAIRNAHNGHSTLSTEAASALVQGAKKEDAPEIEIELTVREQEVLNLMVDGISNNQMAERLFVSPSTIKYHVSNLLSKFGVSRRGEAISMALQYKLVDKK